MASKLKNGSNCAACVRYPETDSDCWILTKVDKKLPGNKYLVRDEYADDPRYETYTVDSSHITPFPSTLNEEYQVGETVLALWRDEETNEWSTMFYNAEVADNKASDPKTVQLLYSGTDFVVDVEKDKIARLPANFTYTEVFDEKEDRTSTTATEEPSEDSSKNAAGKKIRNTKEEQGTTESASPSPAALNAKSADEGTTNTDDISESVTDEKLKDETSLNPTSEDGLLPVKSESLPSTTTNSANVTPLVENESLESKENEHITTDQEAAAKNESNETSENIEQSQNSIQTQSTDNSAKSDDQTSSDKNRRSKSSSKENTTVTSAASSSSSSEVPSSKLSTPESRRIQFMFHKSEVAERPKPDYLTNDDFSRLNGPVQELKRMQTKEGTPLLDYLEDKELFNQESLLHVTGSGVISVANVEKGNEKSGLAEGKIHCGRLGRIINEWTKNPMDSI